MRCNTCRVAQHSLGALILTVSPLALGAAQAQSDQLSQAASGEVDPQAAEAGPSTAAPAPKASSGQIEEIVVTAQRRAEVAQDVPISLQAFSSDSLQRAVVQSTEDLTSLVGGLLVNPTAPPPPLFLHTGKAPGRERVGQ